AGPSSRRFWVTTSSRHICICQSWGRSTITASRSVAVPQLDCPQRAAEPLPERAPARLELLQDLSEAMMETGEFAWAEIFLEEALQGAIAQGDERLRADSVLTGLLVRLRQTGDLEAWRL